MKFNQLNFVCATPSVIFMKQQWRCIEPVYEVCFCDINWIVLLSHGCTDTLLCLKCWSQMLAHFMSCIMVEVQQRSGLYAV